MKAKSNSTTILVIIIILVVILSALIIIGVKVIETNTRKKLKLSIPRPRLRGKVCQPSSFQGTDSVKIRNGCFPDYYVFVNIFDDNSLILHRLYSVFSVLRVIGIVKKGEEKNKSIQFDKDKLVVKDQDPDVNSMWLPNSQNGTITISSYASVQKKWTIVEVVDKNGFFVRRLTAIDVNVEDPVSTAWIIENVK